MSLIVNVFRPLTPSSLSLTNSFTLTYVTAPSSAICFTSPMASSETPCPITRTSLCRLGLKMSQLHRPRISGLSLGKLVVCVQHPSTFNTVSCYGKDIGLRWYTAPHPTHSLTKVHFRLDDVCASSFLQTPHWPNVYRYSLLGSKPWFLRTPLLLASHSLLSRASDGLPPPRRLTCQSHVLFRCAPNLTQGNFRVVLGLSGRYV